MVSFMEDKPPELKLKMLKAIPELVANLYVHFAALDAVIPTDLYGLEAPSVFGGNETSGAALVRSVQQAYANYRAQGGLE
jgi:hypothetical protein